jgi:hypothetical protein
MLNFVENLLENERGPMNDQDLTKTDYDPDRSLVLSRVSLIFYIKTLPQLHHLNHWQPTFSEYVHFTIQITK